MRKTFFISLIILSIFVLIIRFVPSLPAPFLNIFGYKTKTGLQITSQPDQATVFLDGSEMGKTPYQNENLEAKEYNVKLKNDEKIWQGNVKLLGGALAVVNRELSVGIASSSGEVLTFAMGRGVQIISMPDQSEVEIDKRVYGKTPLVVSDLAFGEHLFLISHQGYLKRSIRVYVPQDLQLQMYIDLALAPLSSVENVVPVINDVTRLIIRQTPTGFLRLRDRPSLSSKIVAQVNTGDEVILLEELSGWDKVRASNGVEGYVSNSYVQKAP